MLELLINMRYKSSEEYITSYQRAIRYNEEMSLKLWALSLIIRSKDW